MAEPTLTDPDKYKVIFENESVRVLEYRDEPGQRTSPHEHPDGVMYTLSDFERRLIGPTARLAMSPSGAARCAGSTLRLTAARTSETRQRTSCSWS
jgi:beta-alanine degradation protein BauB